MQRAARVWRPLQPCNLSLQLLSQWKVQSSLPLSDLSLPQCCCGPFSECKHDSTLASSDRPHDRVPPVSAASACPTSKIVEWVRRKKNHLPLQRSKKMCPVALSLTFPSSRVLLLSVSSFLFVCRSCRSSFFFFWLPSPFGCLFSRFLANIVLLRTMTVKAMSCRFHACRDAGSNELKMLQQDATAKKPASGGLTCVRRVLTLSWTEAPSSLHVSFCPGHEYMDEQRNIDIFTLSIYHSHLS